MSLQWLVPIYGSMLLINCVFYFVLWSRTHQRLYAYQLLAYVSFLITLLLQGATAEADYIWRAITASTVFFGLLLFTMIITLIQGKQRYHIQKYFLIYLGSVLVTVVCYMLNVDTNWMVLPSLLGATFPMFDTAFYELFKDKVRPSFITKCFIGSGVVYSCHMLDYAYAVDKPQYLIIGFFLACACIFAFTTFSTAAVIENVMFENASIKLQIKYKAILTNSSKLASLGEMAGGMAHEINNPLAAIQLHSDLLKKSLETNNLDPSVAKNRLNVIGDSLQKISRVITNLRHFSRDTSHDPIVNASIRDVVEQTLSFCRLRFADHGIQVEVKAKEDFLIKCRPMQLSQAMLNLLNNSFDSLVVSKVPHKLIKIEILKNPPMGEIRIIDNGLGIPAEIRSKIFDPFFTTKDVGEGSGLGLSVSLGMIDAQNGTLELDSSGEQTSFLIKIPIS